MGSSILSLILLCFLSAPNTSMKIHKPLSSRRQILATPLPFLATILPTAANARLFDFKLPENTYHLLRAGESTLERDNILLTNALFSTQIENGLSRKGEKQARLAGRSLKDYSITPTIIKFCLATKAAETAQLVAEELNLGRDRVIPEFTFLDGRQVGLWDGLELNITQSAVVALDAQSSPTQSQIPPNIDGTPNDSLEDVFIRLRQLFSVLESSYSGETILLVFPDATAPALTLALFAGIPMPECHIFDFAAGELFLNASPARAISALKTESKIKSYDKEKNAGLQNLALLQSKTSDELVRCRERVMLEELELFKNSKIEEPKPKPKPKKTPNTPAVDNNVFQEKKQKARVRAEAVAQARAEAVTKQKEQRPPSGVSEPGTPDSDDYIALAGGVSAFAAAALAVKSNNGDLSDEELARVEAARVANEREHAAQLEQDQLDQAEAKKKNAEKIRAENEIEAAALAERERSVSLAAAAAAAQLEEERASAERAKIKKESQVKYEQDLQDALDDDGGAGAFDSFLDVLRSDE